MQLLVRVEVGSGVFAQQAVTVDKQEWELQQCPVEFCERLRDPAGCESRIDAAEPRLGRVGIVVGQADRGGVFRLWGGGSGGGGFLGGGSGSDIVWLGVVGCV